MHRVHPAGASQQRQRRPRGRSSLGGIEGWGGGSMTQLVLIALAAATAIFFTTSLLVMDSPINGKGFGPSQFVTRVGRTAALAGVGVGAVNKSSEQGELAPAAEHKTTEGGDVVKTGRANKGAAGKRKQQQQRLQEEAMEEEEEAPKAPAAAAAPSSRGSQDEGSGNNKAKPQPAAVEAATAEPEEEEEEDDEALLAAEVEELEQELLREEEEKEKEQELLREEEEKNIDEEEKKEEDAPVVVVPPSPPEERPSQGADLPEAESWGEAKEEGEPEQPPATLAVTTPKKQQQKPPLAPRAVAEAPAGKTCRAFLEKADAFAWERDFGLKPVHVHRRGSAEGDGHYDVPCFIGPGNDYLGYDAAYGESQYEGVARIKWTMASYTNYPDTEVNRAHESGFEVVTTPRLDAEASCAYFGWAKWEDTFFNPMKVPPVPAKEKENVAAAFISNCGARSFRLHALEALQAADITVHSHGRCANNMPNADKDELLPKIKFSLAFENSIEPDYVTEKYLQALNFGAVPVVIGAPNIQDFAPSGNSIIHIPDEQSLPGVAVRMKYLMANDTAYDEMLAWKVDGPSDQFLALIDIGTVHPECRLCQYLTDRQRRGEMNKRSDKAAARPCACEDPATGARTHHLRIRERHTFEHRSLFLEEPLTVERLRAAIHELYGEDHRPVWARARPSYRKKLMDGSWDRKHVELRIHRVYPSYITQREALYGRAPDAFTLKGNASMDKALATWVTGNPCGLLDVAFV